MISIAWSNTDRDSPDERTHVSEKLNSFKRLPIGWHYGSGGPISSRVIDDAIAINKLFRLVGFARTNVFAGANGGILATAYRLYHYIGVTIEPSGTHSIVYEIGNKEDLTLDDLDLATTQRVILRLAGIIWNISASSTQATTTTIAANSTTWSLRTPPGAGYLSSEYDAQKIPA